MYILKSSFFFFIKIIVYVILEFKYLVYSLLRLLLTYFYSVFSFLLFIIYIDLASRSTLSYNIIL